MNRHLRDFLTPGTKMILLGVFIFSGMAIGAGASMAIGKWVFGVPFGEMGRLISHPSKENGVMLLILNSVSQAFTFLLPSIVFRWQLENHRAPIFLRTSLAFVGISGLWILTAFPMVDFLGYINGKLIPEGSWIESVAKPSEEQAGRLLRLFMDSESNIPSYLLYFCVAFVPALCEEYLFRGVIQSTLFRSTRNIHIAIWVSAVLFSAIHLQPYGFLPRIVLGAMMGYLFFVSGSIIPSILGHAVNNAAGIAFYQLTGHSEVSPLPQWTIPIIIILFGALSFYIYRKWRAKVASES